MDMTAGLRMGPMSRLRRFEVDYIIAGIAALFLFGYLTYALLRPEQF